MYRAPAIQHALLKYLNNSNNVMLFNPMASSSTLFQAAYTLLSVGGSVGSASIFDISPIAHNKYRECIQRKWILTKVRAEGCIHGD